MIWGKVYAWLGSKFLVATLGPDGWVCTDFPVYEEILNRGFSPGNYGPADGDSVVAAIMDAAEILGGTAQIEPRPEPMSVEIY